MEHGCGGRSGLSYRVGLESLPVELQAKWREMHPEMAAVETVGEAAVCAASPTISAAPAGTEPEWKRRRELIQPALANPARSPERVAAIEAVATTHGIAGRTVRRWIAAYEAQGLAGLADRQRANKGGRLVLISRPWDAATGHLDPAVRERIANNFRTKLRALWAGGTPGWRHVARLAAVELIRLTRAAGVDLPDDDLRAVCQVPRALAEREKRYRIVAVKDKDSKAFFDRQPRVRRDYSALKPLELVIGDVHPVDIYYRRDDSSLATPKLIAWLDGASNRLIGHAVFLDKGKGVRMAHVAASFVQVVKAWGMPGALYLDNGGEYNWSEFAADAMRLVKLYDDDHRTVINALPYNAPAKKIEGIFAVLERGPLAMIPGWIGGNRMAKKTHNVGREPEPFPGTKRELWDAIDRAIASYNATPQPGLDGRSPDQVWAAHVDAGWRPVAADMATLQTAFARTEARRLRQGGFTLAGQRYTHDALCARPDLDAVTLRIPVFGDMRPAVYAPDGAFLCHAEPETAYHPFDIEGAKESARRKALARKGVEDLRRDAAPADLTAETAAFLALNPPPEAPEPDGVIRLTPEMGRAAEDRRELPAKRRARERDESERKQERQFELVERWLENHARKQAADG